MLATVATQTPRNSLEGSGSRGNSGVLCAKEIHARESHARESHAKQTLGRQEDKRSVIGICKEISWEGFARGELSQDRAGVDPGATLPFHPFVRLGWSPQPFFVGKELWSCGASPG